MICPKHGFEHPKGDFCPNAVPFLFATGCSGINSCAEAWIPLGWQEAFCAEVEPFPAAVLAHRYGSGRPEVMPNPTAPGTTEDQRKARNAAKKQIKKIPDIVPGSPPNLGDFTRPDFVERAREILAGRQLNVFCAGTPCQGYSVAGLRGSMDDARSNLMFCFVEAYHGLGAIWAVWENVPGCLNTRDNAFGHLLGGLARTAVPFTGPNPDESGKWPSSGIFEGPAGGGAWRVLDAQFLGGCELHGSGAVPQRRERVFIVFRSGKEGSARAAEVLFDPRGEGRDSGAEREAGPETAPYAGCGSEGVSKAVTARQTSGRADPTAETYVVERGRGIGASADGEESGLPVGPDLEYCPHGKAGFPAVVPCLDAGCGHGPIRNQHGAGVVETVGGQVTHALRGEGFDGSEDGTGRGVPIVAMDAAAGPAGGRDGVLPCIDDKDRQDPISSAVAQPLDASGFSQAMAFGSKDSGQDAGPVSPCSECRGHGASHPNGGVPPAVCYDARGNGAGSVVPNQSGDHASRPTDYTPLIVEDSAPKCFTQNQSGDVLTGDVLTGDVAPAMGTNANASGRNTPKLYALMPQNSGKDFKAKESEVSQPVMAAGPTTGNQGGDLVVDDVSSLLPFDTTQLTSGQNRSNPKAGDPCHPIAAGAHPPADAAKAGGCAPKYVVRRFTCRETERLQGFPDDHALIPWRGTKRRGSDLADQRAYLAASGYTPVQVEDLVHCPDGPRYKAVGNSKAVPVIRWIGRRIEIVERKA